MQDELNPYIARHLAISDKLLDCIDRALDEPRELFTVVVRRKSAKNDEEEIYGVERDAIDEKKLCSIVDAISELKDIQRQALGFMDPKDRMRYETDLQKKAGPSGEAIQAFLHALTTPGTEEERTD